MVTVFATEDRSEGDVDEFEFDVGNFPIFCIGQSQ
jgi:hypothetical protein